jgi:hypothetical protein
MVTHVCGNASTKTQLFSGPHFVRQTPIFLMDSARTGARNRNAANAHLNFRHEANEEKSLKTNRRALLRAPRVPKGGDDLTATAAEKTRARRL